MAVPSTVVEIEITPEPSDEEREALDEALARLLQEPADPHGEWWRAGVREALSLEEESA
jgi:hypothetical protein